MVKQTPIDPHYENPVLLWVYCVQQQLSFYNTIIKHTSKNRQLFKIVELDSCLYYILHLLKWVKDDLAEDQFESSVLDTIYEKSRPIRIILRDSKYPPITARIYKDSCRKCELLKNIIIYIEGIMNHNDMLDITIKLIEDVQKGVKELSIQNG